jgi:hypothetical protein
VTPRCRLLALLLCAPVLAGAGEPPAPKTVEVSGQRVPVVPRLAAGPEVDGDLSDAAWKGAAVFKLGHADAGQAGEPENPTTVYAATDAETLYLGFDCVEKHPGGPFVPEGAMAKKEKRIPDHVLVQLGLGRYGRAAWFRFRASPTEKEWMTGSIYSAPASYNGYACHGCFTSRSNDLKLPSYRAKAKVLEGRWTAEIGVKLGELVLYPADGLPDLAEVNFYRVRAGGDREEFDRMMVWDEGPCAWKNFWPHLQAWKRMARPERFKVDHKGNMWDVVQPLWFGLLKLEAGTQQCRTVRHPESYRAARIPGSYLDFFYCKRSHYKYYRYTPEEGNQLRLEWWWDTPPARPEWKPGLKVASARPVNEGGTPAFAARPAVARAGAGWRIRFTVKEPTDVAVGIVGAQGKIVRHLAAGALGGDAPAPLRAGTLAQEIVWDGRDDRGEEVPARGCRVRVSLGLRPVFEYVFRDPRGAELEVGRSKIAPCVGLGRLEPLNWSFHPHGAYTFQLCADPATEQVVLGGSTVFDGTTGKYLRDVKLADLGRFPGKRTRGELCLDGDGNQWVTVLDELRRYGSEGTPLPFEALGTHRAPQIMIGHATPMRGLSFGGPDRDCHVIHHFSWRQNWGGVVSRVGRDGRIKQWGLVECGVPIGCVRADRAGNVYVGCTARPKDQIVPRGFRPVMTEEIQTFYGALYGSVVKFGPSGGRVAQDHDGDLVGRTYNYGKKLKPGFCKITGAEWIRPGFSVMTAQAGPCRCGCATGRFDLDPFERLWIPDAIRSRVDVVDTNGNTLLVVGKFGKISESSGEKIRWGYPKMVAATDEGCYVMDFAGGRALKLKLGYRVQEDVPLVP